MPNNLKVKKPTNKKQQVNTEDSLQSPDNIAGTPYPGVVLLVFCFLVFLPTILMLFSSVLKISLSF